MDIRRHGFRWVCPQGHPLELRSGEGEDRLWRCPVDGYSNTDRQLVKIQKAIDSRWIDPETVKRPERNPRMHARWLDPEFWEKVEKMIGIQERSQEQFRIRKAVQDLGESNAIDEATGYG
jgi:hypothetical protein